MNQDYLKLDLEFRLKKYSVKSTDKKAIILVVNWCSNPGVSVKIYNN